MLLISNIQMNFILLHKVYFSSSIEHFSSAYFTITLTFSEKF